MKQIDGNYQKTNNVKEKTTKQGLNNGIYIQQNKQENKKKKKLGLFTLKYMNEEINKRYQMEQLPIKQQTLNLTLFFQFLINVVYMILNYSNANGQILIFGGFAFIYLVTIFYNVYIKKVNQLQWFLFLLLCIHSIITTIFYNNVQSYKRIDICFLNILTTLYVLDCWLKKSMLLIITILMEYNFQSSIIDYDKIPLIAVLPAYFIILYLNQRQNKLLFYDYFYQQKTLAACQKILDQTLPCSVIVLSCNDDYENQSLLNTDVVEQSETLKIKDKMQPFHKFSRSSVGSYQKQNSFRSINKTRQLSQQIQQTPKDAQQQILLSQNKQTNKQDINTYSQEIKNHAENIHAMINDKIVEKMSISEQNIYHQNQQNLSNANMQFPSFNPFALPQINILNSIPHNGSLYQVNVNKNIGNDKYQSQNHKKSSIFQDILQKTLKVNFVNTTCLNTFKIKRNQETQDTNKTSDRGGTDFYESEELQQEIIQLLQSIEIQTSEYNIQTMNKSNIFGAGFQQNNNKNGLLGLNSQLIMTNSNYNYLQNGLQPGEQSEFLQNSQINSKIPSKKVIVQTSLFDIIKQKYRLLHQKYLEQIFTSSFPNLNVKNKNEKPIQDILKNIDLDQEDVFVNCVYKNEKNAKALDIHIIEFQWIDEPAIMIVMTDISQNVKARRLQDLDSYKNELLATVTHDLKTPLNGMLSILEMSQELTDIDEIKNFIQVVHKNGILLNFLIMDILDYSAMLKGELRLIKQKFDINDVLKDIKDLIGFQAQQKKLKFTIINNLDQTECILDNDQRRIKQILLNLTSNALKFTFEGEIQIQLEKEDLIDNLLKITVKDTGVGIPDSLKPKLFKLYGTYDHNNGSNKHGVGLGLVITKKLASQVGPKDTLRFSSIEKVGTEFSFHLYRKLKTQNSSKCPKFDSPINLSKNLNIKHQVSQFLSNQNPLIERQLFQQQHNANPSTNRTTQQINEIVQSLHGQALLPCFPATINQTTSDPENFLNKISEKNEEFLNTQMHIDTHEIFLTPRIFDTQQSNTALNYTHVYANIFNKQGFHDQQFLYYQPIFNLYHNANFTYIDILIEIKVIGLNVILEGIILIILKISLISWIIYQLNNPLLLIF